MKITRKLKTICIDLLVNVLLNELVHGPKTGFMFMNFTSILLRSYRVVGATKI